MRRRFRLGSRAKWRSSCVVPQCLQVSSRAELPVGAEVKASVCRIVREGLVSVEGNLLLATHVDPDAVPPVVFEEQLVEVGVIAQELVVLDARLQVRNANVGGLTPQVTAVAYAPYSLVEARTAVAAVDVDGSEGTPERLENLGTQVAQVFGLFHIRLVADAQSSGRFRASKLAEHEVLA